MSKEGLIKKIGQVVDALPNTQFKVRLDTGEEIRAYLSGKMSMNKIKVMVGDRVEMEIPSSPHIQNSIARITFRR